MFYLFFLILIPFQLKAQTHRPLCDLLDLPGCDRITKQLRRSSAVSLPSPAAAANINPATVSLDRGFGLEAIHQSGNAVNFNVASGTGKSGAALISHSLENSFFGNRVPEIDEVYFERREERDQYRSKKLNLAIATKLYRSRHFNLDLGIMGKRHSEIKRINPGAGLSGRVGPFTFGASYYQDDFRLELKDYFDPTVASPYNVIYNNDIYTERFNVQTFTVGTRFRNISLDAGFIRSKYKFYEDETSIAIYSAGVFYKKLVFNLAVRKELSDAWKYEDGVLVQERAKHETYAGIQASINRFFVLGMSYNYFLLRELSFSASIFF